MQITNRPLELHTENEVADMLGISLEQLHQLLDEHIFNDGSFRPTDLTFTNSELVLLSFWQRSEPNAKVVRMPRRN
jgi:hypothetical protein